MWLGGPKNPSWFLWHDQSTVAVHICFYWFLSFFHVQYVGGWVRGIRMGHGEFHYKNHKYIGKFLSDRVRSFPWCTCTCRQGNGDMAILVSNHCIVAIIRLTAEQEPETNSWKRVWSILESMFHVLQSSFGTFMHIYLCRMLSTASHLW